MDKITKQDLWAWCALSGAAVGFLVAGGVCWFARNNPADLITFTAGVMLVAFSVIFVSSEWLEARARERKLAAWKVLLALTVCAIGFALAIRPAYFKPVVESLLLPTSTTQDATTPSPEAVAELSDAEWSKHRLHWPRVSYDIPREVSEIRCNPD